METEHEEVFGTIESNESGKPAVTPLAYRPREAAKALGIGERLLWLMTNRGDIPHVRLGRAIVYPVDMLREWLRANAKGGK